MHRFFPLTALGLSLALLALLAGGCGPAGRQAAFTLDYQLRGGIAGFDSRLTVDQSGHFSLTDRGRAVAQGTLTQAELDGLNEQLTRVPWDTLQSRYDAPEVRDDLSHRIALSQGGKTREVTAAGTAQAPPELRGLVDYLEALRQARQPRAGEGNVSPPATPSSPTSLATPASPGLDPAVDPIVKLSDARGGFEAVADQKEKTLYWRGPGGSLQRLIRLRDLPESFTPQGATPDIRFGVSADHFTALALAPEGRRVAFTTMGTHGFLAVVDAPAGSRTGGHLLPLDLGFETGYERLYWSPDGRYLAVLTSPPSGALGTCVYDVQAGTRLDSGWSELKRLLPMEDYSLEPLRWDSPVALRLMAANGASGNGNPASFGDWVLDVSRGALTLVAGRQP